MYGEILLWLITEVGLLHRGTEKLVELHYYTSSLPYFDRLDYVSTITQEVVFVEGLERLLNARVGGFISIIRVLFMEFCRVLNHNLAITTHGIDMGLFTCMLWSFEEREKLLCVAESVSGKRFHSALLAVGRIRYDLSLLVVEGLLGWLFHYLAVHKELFVLLSRNLLWVSRLFGIGIINRGAILWLGLSGVLGRAAAIVLDGRFSGYD